MGSSQTPRIWVASTAGHGLSEILLQVEEEEQVLLKEQTQHSWVDCLAPIK